MKKKEKKKKGRPPIQFDDKDIRNVKKYASVGATHELIAYFLGVSIDTVRSRIRDEGSDFAKAYNSGRTKGLLSLLNTAFYLAVEKKNVAVLIFLLKTVGGLREKDAPPVTSHREVVFQDIDMVS